MSIAFRAFDAFDHHARYAPARAFVDGDSGVLTYSIAAERVNRLLCGFKALGLQHTDRIAVVSKNRCEILLLLLAAMKGGPVVVPVNHRLAPAEMSWILQDCGCRLLIAEAEFANALAGHIPAQLGPEARFLLGGDIAISGWQNFDSWLHALPATAIAPDSDPNDAYLQVYTSGTTGRPKGVVLTERNCIGQQLGLMAASDIVLQPGERLYQALPLFHVGGICVSLWAIYRGVSLVLRRDFSPSAADQLLSDGDVAHASLVPSMIKASMVAGGRIPRSFSTLKSIIYGASPISAECLRDAAARYGCDFLQIYGMTETHSVISALNAADHRKALHRGHAHLIGCAGRPVAAVEIRIADADDRALPQGQVGEICVRAPQVMAGYWNQQEATRETLRDGYLRTGDAGFVDASGYVHIIDRLKDIIVSGGENVASKEVEDVLLQHPDVLDAAVIGVPDERWGELVKALIVSHGGDVDEAALIAHCREHLGGFKVPKSIGRIDSIPRNGAGKILKTQLRERYWLTATRRVS